MENTKWSISEKHISKYDYWFIYDKSENIIAEVRDFDQAKIIVQSPELLEENERLKTDLDDVSILLDRERMTVSTLTEENKKLRGLSRNVLETSSQYQFFLTGYRNGSASISEVNMAAQKSDYALNELQNLIHSDQTKTE